MKSRSTVKIASRFMGLPAWTRVTAATAGAVIILGAVSVPVAAVAVDQHNRQLSLATAAKEAAAEAKASAKAAAALTEARDAAALFNAGFDGFTVSLAAAVHPDAAAAFETARVTLAFAIADGELEEVSAAVTAVTRALDGLVASAQVQAEALIAASPLAGASGESLAKAVAELRTADDVGAALARVKTATDAVVAAQAAGQAAADAAAKQESEGEADASNGGASPGGHPANGGGSVEDQYDDFGIIGMTPGERGSCGEYPNGQVVTRDFGWRAFDGNTVDIFFALTDGDYQATGDFTLLVSDGGSSGSVSIPVVCPVGPGLYSYITVKAVASSRSGSAAAYYWGL